LPRPTITPASQKALINQMVALTVSGGLPPYRFRMFSGLGFVDDVSGVYTAPALQTTAIIRVTDANDMEQDASISVNPFLAITPATKTVVAGTSTSYAPFVALGGIPPYAYSLVPARAGGIDAAGNYSAATAVIGTEIVRVTDSTGVVREAVALINPSLSIFPATLTRVIPINSAFTFSASGGVPPYLFEVMSGGGFITSVGVYTAPATPSSPTIRVLDSAGWIQDSVISVAVLTPLALSPAIRAVAAGSLYPYFSYTATGGVAPYTFSMVSGGGTMDAVTGLYTAPAAPSALISSAVVRVTDSAVPPINRDGTVFINPTITLSPVAKTIATGASIMLVAANGVPPYTFSVASGASGVLSSSGLFTGASAAGVTTIRVTDGQSNFSDSIISVVDNALGALDATYGTGGKVTTAIGTSDDFAIAQAIQTDGMVVVAGYSNIAGDADFALARYRTDGTLDPAFGTGSGKVVLPMGTGNDYGTSVAIQADGKIVVGGYCLNGATSYDFCVARLSAAGALDTAGFGAGTGKAFTAVVAGGTNDYANALAIQTDGKIVVAGTCYNGATLNDFCTVRYNTTGTLDTVGFGAGTGKVVSFITAGAFNDTATSVALQSDGKIVVGGYGYQSAFNVGHEFAVARYNLDGTLDTSFNNTGKLTLNIPNNFYFNCGV